MKYIPLYRFKDVPIDLLSERQLLDHAADLIVRPLKYGGKRLREIKLAIIDHWTYR